MTVKKQILRMHAARMLLVTRPVKLSLLVLACGHPQIAFARELCQNACPAEYRAGGTDESVSVFRSNRLQPVRTLLEHKPRTGAMLFHYSLQIVTRLNCDLRARLGSVCRPGICSRRLVRIPNHRKRHQYGCPDDTLKMKFSLHDQFHFVSLLRTCSPPNGANRPNSHQSRLVLARQS
jgi:hypothetical protein